MTPNSLELLKEVTDAVSFPTAAGERLYTIEDFYRFTAMRAARVLQMDPSHCGGLLVSKKAAAMAAAQDIRVAPHCSVGPIALCAALHLDWSTPNVMIQEDFSQYDVSWRSDFVCGWNAVRNGEFMLPDTPGLGIELDEEACRRHPYKKQSFPSLWDNQWLKQFTQKDKRPD